MHKLARGLILALSLAALTACDSAEERAEKHFQTALAHIEAGDTDRAKVEFRNVFDLNGHHREARMLYARMLREEGDLQQSYGQYLRLIEQYPETLEGRIALAEMAIDKGDWEEAERHGQAAIEQVPDDPAARAVKAVLDYRAGVMETDDEARQAAIETARTLLAQDPTLLHAHRLVISDHVSRMEWADALTAIDSALAARPEAVDLYPMRLAALREIGEPDAIEEQLRELVTLFPEDENMRRLLIRWYVQQGNLPAAETHLRDQIDHSAETADAEMALIQFLASTQGAEAARTELDGWIADGDRHPVMFRSLRAGLDFRAGRRQEAIADMEAMIEGAEPSEEVRNAKVVLAEMLIAEGNPVGARALVEEVLAEDAGAVEALKLKAAWLIEDDRTGDAIVALREAIGQTPRDAELMTLMARAHERDGNSALMGEMLALAAKVSGNAPAETLNYAGWLAQEERLMPAEDALIQALRLAPENVSLLEALGNIYLQLRDWGRTEQIIDALGRIDGDQAKNTANVLTASKLETQNRAEDLMSFLETMAAEGQGGLGTHVAIVQSHLVRGDVAAALSYTTDLLEASPEDREVRFLHAGVLATNGRTDDAEGVYRDLLAESPEAEQVWLALFALHAASADDAGAMSVLDEAETALPESTAILFARAGLLEQQGNIDEAIAVYETLYERDSNSLAIANNLASLLTSHRDDDDALARAATIARRLRGSDVPQFQDTYGWIAHRMGNTDEALTYLEPAAERLPDDPIVQYHLAAAYAASGATEMALEQFRKVSAMVEPAGAQSLRQKADEEIVRLSAEGNPGDAAPAGVEN